MTARLQFARKHAGVRTVPFVDDARAMAIMLASARSNWSELYRGLPVSLLGAVPVSLVYMPTYELSKSAINGFSQHLLPASQVASVVTGVVSSSVRVPISVVKARLQTCVYATSSDAVMAALAGGWRGLYAGWPASCVLDVTYALVQFTALEQFRSLGLGLSGGRPLTAAEDSLIGFLTGAVTAVCTEPLDVIRLRLQTQQRGEGKVDFGYNGLVDGFAKLARQEGVLALWRGILPRLLLKSVGSAIWYTAYRCSRRYLDDSGIRA
eukprot:CAMPEP_0119381182 /NCGR_PEP_ID=MMETSP1334-20130426/61744_1 /TAXON_ID=127549 /ORGANISM="Calcidiscus leptoporus, Strain RCC1130" /LENGTH=265 /DNA_ID=CAMNT_0007401233 /DNA_START=306 /DNA_END=1103 /DNA_ORIENTATION=-